VSSLNTALNELLQIVPRYKFRGGIFKGINNWLTVYSPK